MSWPLGASAGPKVRDLSLQYTVKELSNPRGKRGLNSGGKPSISQNPDIFGNSGNSGNASISSTMRTKMTRIIGCVSFQYLRQFWQICNFGWSAGNAGNLSFQYLRQFQQICNFGRSAGKPSISQNPDIFGNSGNSGNASISSTMRTKMTRIIGCVSFQYLRQFWQICNFGWSAGNAGNLSFQYLRQFQQICNFGRSAGNAGNLGFRYLRPFRPVCNFARSAGMVLDSESRPFRHFW